MRTSPRRESTGAAWSSSAVRGGRFGPHDLTERNSSSSTSSRTPRWSAADRSATDAELLDRRRERAPVPSVARGGSHQVDVRRIDPAAQQGPGEGLAVIR